MLAQGQLDVLAGNMDIGLFNAMARGARLKIVADKGNFGSQGCTHTAIVVRPALAETGQLAHSSGWRGLRIAVNPSSPFEFFAEYVIRGFGLKPGDVEIIDVPSLPRIEALDHGTLDAAVSGEPWLTRILQGGHGVVSIPSHEVLPDFQMAILTFGPSLLEDRPEMGRRFMVAYLEGVRQYARGKTTRNLEILARGTGLDRSLLMKTCWSPFRLDGRIHIESILEFQDWAMEKGHLDRKIPPHEFWEPSFIQYANQVLPTHDPVSK
jgi:NitT/TauT family transport system substrate-binding protein